jgi:hypothetical protein
MRQLVGEVLRGGRVLYEGMRNALRVGRRYVESYNCRCECIERLFAFGGKARFQPGQDAFVVFVRRDLPL